MALRITIVIIALEKLGFAIYVVGMDMDLMNAIMPYQNQNLTILMISMILKIFLKGNLLMIVINLIGVMNLMIVMKYKMISFLIINLKLIKKTLIFRMSLKKLVV